VYADLGFRDGFVYQDNKKLLTNLLTYFYTGACYNAGGKPNVGVKRLNFSIDEILRPDFRLPRTSNYDHHLL